MICYEPYTCAFCPARYKTRTDLQEHRKMHRGFYPFRCELCIKKFLFQDQLKTHMEREHDERETINQNVVAEILDIVQLNAC
ncbi:hypothetical protein TNIN_204901 [Trichonephila inaurata madagascariensis]|uniref:C2H2-type domain-containing protein n=1 Tax=Trichonephila inaurata madagascariensis TaxID=2747483 RepID=A0A8X6Y1T8_9ARAC|nr:hypothetical protein TNIN_204901 [Trichonephila inaurata madagascariensis]